VPCRRGFFLPVRVLSRMFRGKFLAYLKEAFEHGELQFHGKLTRLKDPRAFADYLKCARKTDWVVYSEPPFGGPAQVLDYLGRYTHRVAISNHRLVALQDRKITFRWKDYSQGNRIRLMTLDAGQFIRRFLLQVLPSRFMRLRHYGLLVNRDRNQKLARCRVLLPQSDPPEAQPSKPTDWKSWYQAVTGISFDICPACRQGHMVCVEVFSPTISTSKRHYGRSPHEGMHRETNWLTFRQPRVGLCRHPVRREGESVSGASS
jgi:hypothetical protein